MTNDIVKSIMDFSWAMSLFGVRQMANFLMPEAADSSMHDVTEAFHAMTSATEDQIGHALKEAFKAGEQLQSSMTDMSAPFLELERFDPGHIMQVPMAMMNRVTGASTPSKRGSYYGGWDAV